MNPFRQRAVGSLRSRRQVPVVVACVAFGLFGCVGVDGPYLEADGGVALEQGALGEVQQPICSTPVPPPIADIARGPSAADIIPYRFIGTTGNNDLVQQWEIIRRMLQWEARGTIKFDNQPNNPRALAIDITPNKPQPCQPGYLPPECSGDWPMLHEVGHAAGLAHEHQRIDSTRFITLNPTDDICTDSSEATLYRDTIWSGTNFGPYNENSELHYGPNPGAMTPGGAPVDGTFDFARRGSGTTAGLGALSVVTDGDFSAIDELRVRHLGWDRFRSRGTAINAGPLVTVLSSNASLNPTQQIAAARLKSADLVLVYGSDGHVYMSSRGTKSSAWKDVWSSATHIAATTQGSQLVRARATSTGITTQRTNNAVGSLTAAPEGGDAFLNAVTWPTSLSWGLPSTSPVYGMAIASLSSNHLAVLVVTLDGTVWLRQTTSTTSVTDASWTRVVETATATSRPAMAAFQGQLRIYSATLSSGTTTLWERQCSSTSSCGAPTSLGAIQAGATPAVAAASGSLHIAVRRPFSDPNVVDRLEWKRLDVAAQWTSIGGPGMKGQPAVTNAFSDSFGAFSLFAVLSDSNLWQKTYSNFFRGRLANLPINDLDRDGRTDFVYVRDGSWAATGSSGLPIYPFTLGAPGDVFLPAVDYNGDQINDAASFRPTTRTWSAMNVERKQVSGTGSSTFVEAKPPASALSYGVVGMRPVPGDYDGDWTTDEAYFDIASNIWRATLSTDSVDFTATFGKATDRMVPADYDGDGKTDAAYFRPSEGRWYVRPSSGGADYYVAHCSASDRLAPGDYDGDGRADFGCYKPSAGQWVVKLQTGEPDLLVTFGEVTDRVVPGDYDGDGRMDPAVFRPRQGKWYVRPSGGGADIVKTFGKSTDELPWPEYTRPPKAINDLDGDGKTDSIIVRTGEWWVRMSSTGAHYSAPLAQTTDRVLPVGNFVDDGLLELVARQSNGKWVTRSMNKTGDLGAISSRTYGTGTDIPVPGDYDGDGVIDEAYFRPEDGTWHAQKSGGGADLVVAFGVSTDVPVPGDYDGDGRSDPAVYRSSNKTWYARPSAGGSDLWKVLGQAGDRLVPADYDGDGRTDFAVFHPSNGNWQVHNSSTNTIVDKGNFGVSTDRLVPGDYDGDGKADLALFRPSDGGWYARPSTGGADLYVSFGQSGDKLPWPVHVGN